MSYEYKYPRPMVTVDALVFANNGFDLNVLLIRRGNPPFKGKWALPGGFVDMDETLDHAVARELEEEAGVRIEGFRQFYTFGNPGRDPRGRSITVVFLKEISEKI
jgi:8-oxo-dGTP diphosphatase